MPTLQEELRERFDYSPNDPLAFRWRISKWRSKRQAGDIAGYWHAVRAASPILRRYIEVDRRRIPLSRAVWVFHYGTEPPKRLGFRNGDAGDCRLENLDPDWQQPSAEQAKANRRRYHLTARAKISDEQYSEQLRRQSLRRNYGLTQEQYNQILISQNGNCAICGNRETMVRHGKPDGLAIDHCHISKRIRGLLCTNCNSGLGRFKDNPEALRRAAAYLEKGVS